MLDPAFGRGPGDVAGEADGVRDGQAVLDRGTLDGRNIENNRRTLRYLDRAIEVLLRPRGRLCDGVEFRLQRGPRIAVGVGVDVGFGVCIRVSVSVSISP